ncbi:MAG: signal peptidase [Gemmataceae bacterium]|nr:signal peptidase [Gemmataceae bacterium]
MSDTPASFIVRHGATRVLGDFTPTDATAYVRGDRVVLKTERGLEVGDVLCPTTPAALAQLPDAVRGEIVRRMTPDDIARWEQTGEQTKKDFDTACGVITARSVPMQLIEAERLFGGERLILYFLSEKRIDFRELVKDLARTFHTRIELRQVGVRDEAKLKADYGDCGKPVCCNTHLVVMPPVSMKMAKLQKSTLDPNKISGRCGRLKCCLRYEQDVYEEHQREMPPVNSRVVTNQGQARVLNHEILARRVLVEYEDGRRIPISLDDILTRLERAEGPPRDRHERPPRPAGRKKEDDSGPRPGPRKE